jgi:TPR repeat protein
MNMRLIATIMVLCSLASFAQTPGELVRQAAEQQLGRSTNLGQVLSRMTPEQSSQLFNAMIRTHFEEVAEKQRLEKERQDAARQAAQATAVQSWNESVQNAGLHAEENKNKALQYNLDLAKKGNDYGEYRMGQRYRDGEDVPKDMAKAREWFVKAIAHGNLAASNELARLPALLVQTNSEYKSAPVVSGDGKQSPSTNSPKPSLP